MRGRDWDIEYRQDQVLGMIDDMVQFRFTLPGIPTNVVIAWCRLAGCRTESEYGHDCPSMASVTTILG